MQTKEQALAERIIQAGVIDRILTICLVGAMAITILWYGIGNYIADVPEPEFWISFEKEVMRIP